IVSQKDEEIGQLRSQLDKYKSVLSIHSSTLAQPRKTRLLGISAEPQSKATLQDLLANQLEAHPKSEQTRALVTKAIMENDFLKHLTMAQINEIASCMSIVTQKQNDIIIKEGDVGSKVYVLEEGQIEVSKDGKIMSVIQKPGSVFGELAILYNCTRTATIRAITDCKLWAIERQSFQSIMMKSGLLRQRDHIEFLKTVPEFKNLPVETLSKISGLLEENSYKNGDYIIRQGAKGDTFFIISNGQVKVTKTFQDETTGHLVEKYIRSLKRGDFFGEKALQSEDIRTANIIADGDDVSCLVIDRECFEQFISNLDEIRSRQYDDNVAGPPINETYERKIEEPYASLRLEDIRFVTTLGNGGFGRVELVTMANDHSRSYALKVMKKCQIVETRQEQHILNEKRIMLESDSTFIVKLYRTFKDRKYLYMLMEPCLGGELWTILRDRGSFDEQTTKFYTACVVEAFAYLHSRHIIYRDLKPENMLLDEYGYIKLTDFGFAKRLLPPGSKTWTFCGTPEYVSPEIILNRGHDYSCDYWSLGVLMFELLTGSPPFTGADPMKTYNIILRGIEAVDFARSISAKAANLIKKLCRDNPTERLGYQRGGIDDIKKHKWFDGFYWGGLKTRTLPAPYVPTIRSPTDTSNFDHYPPDTSEAPEDDSGSWDENF
ncbi:cGMP-dependent protein kinase, isozyme 2 forms cD4/T1/T3A/T3B, partial [Fragariocoptes setiger]